MTRPTLRTTAYWLTTILGPTSFLMGGFLGVTRDPQMLATLHHLGYPDYFATISGAWKILGALAVVAPGLPRLKEWAVAPLAFLGLVAASWALRPASRRLAAPGDPEVRMSQPVTHRALALSTR